MKKISGVYVLDTSDIKILVTVSELNKENYYPLNEGVYKILTGSEDPDIFEFRGLPTYKTLLSFSSKKVSRLILMLLRYNYLERIYDKVTNALYLKITVKGQLEIENYKKKHKYKFIKKENKKAPVIVKIC